MRKYITVLFFLLFASFGFAQAYSCKTTYISISKSQLTNTSNFYLTISGEFLPSSSLQAILSLTQITEGFTVNPLGNGTLHIIHSQSSNEKTISIDMLDSNSTQTICVSEYHEKLGQLFDDNLSQILINTKTGIPFLTFTEIN